MKRDFGSRPRARRSSVKLVSLENDLTMRSATNVPEPWRCVSRPSATRPDGLAHRHAGEVEQLGQFALAGQRLARREFAVLDGVLERPAQVLVGRGAARVGLAAELVDQIVLHPLENTSEIPVRANRTDQWRALPRRHLRPKSNRGLIRGVPPAISRPHNPKSLKLKDRTLTRPRFRPTVRSSPAQLHQWYLTGIFTGMPVVFKTCLRSAS